MKLIFDTTKIIKKGEKAVKIKVKVKNLPDLGPLTKVLKNKVFNTILDSAGIKTGYEIVDNLIIGGNTNKAIFLVNNDEDIIKIINRITKLYKDTIKEIQRIRSWRGNKKIEINY